MATVTSFTAARMAAIEDSSVVGGHIDDSGHLILEQHDGTEIDAGAMSGKGVQIITGIAESDLPSSYPVGVSLMDITDGSGWSLNSGYGTVVTDYVDDFRCVQTFYASSGGTSKPAFWIRSYNSADGGGGWTGWQQVVVMVNLDSSAFTQTTALSSYPLGQSRLYYTSTNSSAWDFSGTSGEIVTYRDGSDFIRQTWTQHVAGSATRPQIWTRTGNSAGGWSGWHKNEPVTIASGNITITPVANTPTSGTVTFPSGLFTSAPNIQLTANTNSPGSKVTEVTVNNVTSTGCTIYIYRTDTTATGIYWLATL